MGTSKLMLFHIDARSMWTERQLQNKQKARTVGPDIISITSVVLFLATVANDIESRKSSSHHLSTAAGTGDAAQVPR
jgi:hypothetical protein